jgi:hypothetical protein
MYTKASLLCNENRSYPTCAIPTGCEDLQDRHMNGLDLINAFEIKRPASLLAIVTHSDGDELKGKR